MKHAEHCLPLTMANSLGFVVRSPGSFRVEWSGDYDDPTRVSNVQDCVVDAHSAHGTFTVQPGFVARTGEVGDFLMVRSIPNLRGARYAAMEAVIEAWWQPGEFGLVLMLQGPGTVDVLRGDQLAQICVYQQDAGEAQLRVCDGVPDETELWRSRRSRPEYRKDLDYLKGRHPDGTAEPTHRRNWRPHRSPGHLERHP